MRVLSTLSLLLLLTSLVSCQTWLDVYVCNTYESAAVTLTVTITNTQTNAIQTGNLGFKQCMTFPGVGVSGQSYTIGITGTSNPPGATPLPYTSSPFALRDNSGQNVILLAAQSRHVTDLAVILVPEIQMDVLSESAYYAGNFARDMVTVDFSYPTPAGAVTHVATALPYLSLQGLKSTAQALGTQQSISIDGFAYRNASTETQVQIVKSFNEGIDVPVGYSYYIVLLGSIGGSATIGDGYSTIMINRPATGNPPVVQSSTGVNNDGSSGVNNDGSSGVNNPPPNNNTPKDNGAFAVNSFSPLFLVFSAIIALFATRL